MRIDTEGSITKKNDKMLQKLWSQTTRQLEPLSLAAGLIGGANAAGSILNPIMQGIQNNKNRKWAEKMYNLQRTHALQDWQMQNEYNSPTAQMARLKSAGLNPHLVYGDGTVANSSSAPRSADSPNYQGEAPVFDPRGLMSFVDVQAKEAQTNATEQAIKNAEKQMELTQANILKTLQEVKTGALDYDTKSQLQQYQVTAAKLMNEKLDSEIDVLIAETGIRRVAQQIAEETQYQRIDTITAELLQKQLGNRLTAEQINLIKQDQTLKNIEIMYRKKGINPNDPTYQKYITAAIIALIKKMGYDPEQLLK